jgi:hypothetical protein
MTVGNMRDLFPFPRILYLVRNEIGMMISGETRREDDVRYYREDFIARAFDAGGNAALDPNNGNATGTDRWSAARSEFMNLGEEGTGS